MLRTGAKELCIIMTNINLLPWREQKLTEKNRIFATIAGIIALGCFGLSSVFSLYIQGLNEDTMQEVRLLTTEIGLLESKIAQIKGLQERQNLLASKREIIQALQASRPFIVKLFADIPNAMPDGVYLTSISRKDNKLVLGGISASNSRISIFMSNLEQLKWLRNTTLQEIKSQTNQGTNAETNSNKEIIFSLQGDVTY